MAGPLVLLIGMICLIGFGESKEREGWIVVGHPVESNSTSFTYQSELVTSSSLFRGNDLFRVSSLQISRPDIASSQNQLREKHRGELEFQTSSPLAEGERLSVDYQLSWRPEKVLPALAIALISALALFLVSQGARLIGKHGLLNQPGVRIAAKFLFLLVLFIFVWCNLANPGWAYGDNHQFLTSTVRGKYLPPTIYPHIGRFFPLGLIEMNCLIPFGDSPLVYHLERSLLLCLAAGAMYALLTRITNPGFTCLLLILFLLTPELFRVFSESIFAEALLIVCLASFWLFYHRAQESGRLWAVIAACSFAGIATYCKEPVFGLFSIFAIVQLLFGYRELNRKTLTINLFLLLNAVVFMGVYWWICSAGESYAELRNAETGVTRAGLFMSKCQHPFFLVSMLVGLYRVYRLFILRDKNLLFFDGALFAGLGYFGAYIVLRLDADYYLVPAYVGWVIAFAGYLEQLSQKLLSTESPVQQKRVGRVLSLAIGLLALCMILRIPTTQKCIANVIESRNQSIHLSSVFAELKKSGYELSVYYPPDSQGHEKAVQDWRLTVLNVFDANLETSFTDETTYRNGPFKNTELDELKERHRKSIVICPPKGMESLQRSPTNLGRFRQVRSVPNVMGAWMYTQTDCIHEVERIAAQYRNLR